MWPGEIGRACAILGVLHKGANFFYFPLISNPFFLFRVRYTMVVEINEMTDLNVIFSIRIAQIGNAVILLSIV
jgi:hypothetical protein